VAYQGAGENGGTQSGAQALGTHQHTIYSHLKHVFEKKFRPKYV